MIKLIIFDWDDVIVTGAKEGYFDCYHKAIKSAGVSLPRKVERERILAKWSKTNEEEIRHLVKENPQVFPKAFQNFNKEYWGRTFIKHQKLIRGVKKTLVILEKQYKLAVATSGNKEMIIKKVMPYFGIPRVFSAILSSEEMPSVSKMKPNPTILKRIMNSFRIKPSETIYVGDSNTDVQMAHKANVISIAVLTGNLTESEAKKEQSDYIIKDITKIKKVLQNL